MSHEFAEGGIPNPDVEDLDTYSGLQDDINEMKPGEERDAATDALRVMYDSDEAVAIKESEDKRQNAQALNREAVERVGAGIGGLLESGVAVLPSEEDAVKASRNEEKTGIAN